MLRNRSDFKGGPRNWLKKSPLKKPGKKQRVTICAIVSSTWESKFKPRNTRIVKSIGHICFQPDRFLSMRRQHNLDALKDPSNSIMVLFHGHSGGGSIVKIGELWYKVVAQTAVYKSFNVRDNVCGWKGSTRTKENTSESKFALIRVKRPEAHEEFEQLTAQAIKSLDGPKQEK